MARATLHAQSIFVRCLQLSLCVTSRSDLAPAPCLSTAMNFIHAYDSHARGRCDETGIIKPPKSRCKSWLTAKPTFDLSKALLPHIQALDWSGLPCTLVSTVPKDQTRHVNARRQSELRANQPAWSIFTAAASGQLQTWRYGYDYGLCQLNCALRRMASAESSQQR